MKTAADYFAVLSKNARHEPDAWWLISERIGTSESRKTKLRATLQFFDQESKLDELLQVLDSAPENTSLSPELSGLIKQLTCDLEKYVRPEDLIAFRDTHFGLLPLSSAASFCLNRTFQGEQFKGFLVILNEGLWVCAHLLAKAFVLENLYGDFEEFRRSGQQDFDVAIRHYLAPTGKNANSVFFENTPPEVHGELSAAQSSMAILILQFVLLHEVGHIANRDFDLIGEYRFHVDQASAAPSAPTQKYWDAENAADEYSLDAICRYSRADINRWANFFTIYVFFHWLASIEKVTGRPLCPLHPSPSDRGERLLGWMLAHYPPDEQVTHYITHTQKILQSWNERYSTMSTLNFTIRTKNQNHPLTSGVASTADDPNVIINVLSSRKAPGIATSELLINIAIAIGTGVPVGIAADWLSAKLELGKDTRLYSQLGELIATVKQLEQKLEDTRQSNSGE